MVEKPTDEIALEFNYDNEMLASLWKYAQETPHSHELCTSLANFERAIIDYCRRPGLITTAEFLAAMMAVNEEFAALTGEPVAEKPTLQDCERWRAIALGMQQPFTEGLARLQ